MGKDICVQGLRSPAPQRDILAFDNNLHIKIRIVPWVFTACNFRSFPEGGDE